MAILFSDRALVEKFTTRNVVFESNASLARTGDLIIRSVVEFGDNGYIKRQAIIKTDSLHTFSVATEMGKYQAVILDIIDGLECFTSWLGGNKEETFSHFMDHESPLYFHGKMDKGMITFGAYGPNLNNLELKCSNSRNIETTPFSDRIKAIAEMYRGHLKSLDEKIQLADIIAAQVLNKQEQVA